MDITIPVLLLLLVFGMSLYYLLMRMIYSYADDDREPTRILRPMLKRRRKLKTPPCSKCMNGFLFYGQWYCNCNEYKEQVERLTTKRPEYVSASDVRGTKWCRYEPGLEDGEGI